MKQIVAIDPGKSGGIAFTDGDGIVQAINMPDTPTEMLEALQNIRSCNTQVLVIEQLPRFVGKNIPSSTTSVLFENYGICIGIALALGYRLERVDPHAWQKNLGLGTAKSCASKSEWKRKLKNRAAELFPHLDVTLATADALLIHDWARKSGA